MKKVKPKTRRAFRQAMKDMLPIFLNLRLKHHNRVRPRVNESLVIGSKILDTIEQRRLNRELGLTTFDGQMRWYKKSY